MKINILVTLLMFLMSCNLKDTMERVKKINSDISTTYKHEEVYTKIGWGDDEDDNYISVTFYKYDVGHKSYNDLQQLANQVTERIRSKNPDLKNTDNIIVRFTKLDNGTEDQEAFVVFKQKKK